MRSTHDLLVILKDYVLNDRQSEYPTYMYSGGLCESLSELEIAGTITTKEEQSVTIYLYNHKPLKKCKDKGFYWLMHLIKPRLSWCTRHIKLTKP